MSEDKIMKITMRMKKKRRKNVMKANKREILPIQKAFSIVNANTSRGKEKFYFSCM